MVKRSYGYYFKYAIYIIFILIIQIQASEICRAQPIPDSRIWQEGLSPDTFFWTYQNFSGFFYNIDNNYGTESLKICVAGQGHNKKIIRDHNLDYSTKRKEIDYEFDQWGKYYGICFLGKKYFAGYSTNSEIVNNDINLIGEGTIFRILKDEAVGYPLGVNSALSLEEGYEVNIIDVNTSRKTAVLYLRKNGNLIDRRIVSLDDPRGPTITFDKFVNQVKIPLIILHLTMPFSSGEFCSVTIDGIFQISENPISLKDNFDIHDMDIIDTHNRIELQNSKAIAFKRHSTIPLFGDIGIRVADSDKLRFMPVQIESTNYRSAPIDSEKFDLYILTPSNFDGFYYDIDNDIATEQLELRLTDGNRFSEPEGIVYTTIAQRERFKFTDWGYFKVIGFLGEKYFGGYISDENIPPENQIPYAESTDKDSLSYEQLEAILKDEDDEMTVTSGTSIKMDEGYELAIKSIDIDGCRIYLELTKDGTVVDSRVISLTKDKPTDSTYFYKKDVGDQMDLVIISVFFKNAFRGSDANLATIKGIWQISEYPVIVKTNTEYGRMRIVSITSDSIKMDNRDNSIGLGRDEVISLMGSIYIETADSDEQRYLIRRSNKNPEQENSPAS